MPERLQGARLLTSVTLWCYAISTRPSGVILRLRLSLLPEWFAIGLAAHLWEEEHRDFSLIGTMHFGTAREILMAS